MTPIDRRTLLAAAALWPAARAAAQPAAFPYDKLIREARIQPD